MFPFGAKQIVDKAKKVLEQISIFFRRCDLSNDRQLKHDEVRTVLPFLLTMYLRVLLIYPILPGKIYC